MRTPPEQLPDSPFDLIVIGAGIHGLCLAWLAARAGVRVAVLERSDIGTEATANSLRIVHGGLRYLQRLDLQRMRRSMQARRWFLKAVPELVEPLECTVPAGGSLKRSAMALRLGFLANDLICAGANRGLTHNHRLPRSRMARSTQLSDPQLQPTNHCQGTGHWWDARLIAPGRLCVELAMAASAAGAAICTYSPATEILTRNGRVLGVRVRNALTGTEVDIQGQVVLDTSGAAGKPLRQGLIKEDDEPGWVGAANVLLRRRSGGSAAIGLRAHEGGRAGAPMRDFFFVPLAGRLSAGTTYIRTDAAEPEEQAVGRAVTQLLDELNAAAPMLDLVEDDVQEVFWGRLPTANRMQPGNLTLQEHGRLVAGTAQGYWLVTSTKFTTAPIEALSTLRQLEHLLPLRTPLTLPETLHGDNKNEEYPGLTPSKDLYFEEGGNNFENCMKLLRQAFLQEGAISLEDALRRRMELLPCDFPDATVLDSISRHAATTMAWNELERRRQRDRVIRLSNQHPNVRAANRES